MIIMVMLIIMMNMLSLLLIIETTESFKTMVAKVQEHCRKNSEGGLIWMFRNDLGLMFINFKAFITETNSLVWEV